MRGANLNSIDLFKGMAMFREGEVYNCIVFSSSFIIKIKTIIYRFFVLLFFDQERRVKDI